MLEMPTFLLSKVGMEAKRRVCDSIALEGLRIGHHAILASLDEFGSSTQREIADRLHFDASDVVALLDELEAREWIERRRDDVDRRRNVVSLTAAGRKGLRNMQRDALAVAGELLAPLSADEQAQLTDMLRRVFSSYDPRG